MRQGEDAPAVIQRAKEKLDEIQKSLPDGVKIISVYDRSDIIERAIDTLRTTLLERASDCWPDYFTLPMAYSVRNCANHYHTRRCAYCIYTFVFNGANIEHHVASGIAISIGVLVDGAIVEVENAYRKIQHWDASGRKESFFEVRLSALKGVSSPYSFLFLLLLFHLFPSLLRNQEGRLF